MLDGRPFILVVGAADTGRSPLVLALLRHALPEIEVRSAGVVSHEGDPADDMVVLALDHLGARLGAHTARALHADELAQADLVLAVDRGVGRVLTAQHGAVTTVAALSDLARLPDVLDPHRMPLGLWIAAARDFQTQITAALPQIRQQLGLQGAAPAVAAPAATAPAASPAPEPAPTPAPPAPAEVATDRQEPLARIKRLAETALALPEIVDWSRLRSEIGEQLRLIAATTAGPLDFTPAATTMLDGLLAQAPTIPSAARLALFAELAQQLAAGVDAQGLAHFGSAVARWNTL